MEVSGSRAVAMRTKGRGSRLEHPPQGSPHLLHASLCRPAAAQAQLHWEPTMCSLLEGQSSSTSVTREGAPLSHTQALQHVPEPGHPIAGVSQSGQDAARKQDYL